MRNQFNYVVPSILVLWVVLALIARPAAAEDSYQWTDRQGRVFYGSNPPKNALSVTKLPPKALSRYSSDRMLSRLGWKGQKTNSKTQPAEKKPITPARPAALEAEEARVELDEQGQVKSCVAAVRNNGESSAVEINIAFDFPDGTLVPGVGPNSISPNSSADYAVPNELLPLQVKAEESADGAKTAPKPRVIV
ncbi:MAG TPA: DUF4124 domain-containing protein, partial [Oligoflexia bacterium]|nr:DUF4124 domain-containing protein [Oligoflexia bacterium]